MEEKEDCTDNFSRIWSESHPRPNQSQWLQSTLNDLDEKTKTMVSIIQNDGESFLNRAETLYMRRRELISILQNLHSSYKSLAENYHQVRREFILITTLLRRSVSTSSSSTSLGKSILVHDDHRPDQVTRCSDNSISTESSERLFLHEKMEKEVDEGDHTNLGLNNTHQEILRHRALDGQDYVREKILVQDNVTRSNNSNNTNYYSIEYYQSNEKEPPYGGKFYEMGSTSVGGLGLDLDKEDKMWHELRVKVSQLLEENLEEQSELVKRNEEKREMIKKLRLQVNRLLEENRALKNSLPSYNKSGVNNGTQSRLSKLKGLNCIGKFRD